MPKTHKKTFLLLGLICIISLTMVNLVHAAESDNIIETSLFGNLNDDGKGCGIYTVLHIAITIFSAGVGILGIIGIGITGVQLVTSHGEPEKVQKARRRLFEIIIGLTVYAILFTLSQWLLPGGTLDTNSDCATTSDTELAAIKEKEKAEKRAAANPKNSNDKKANSKSDSTPTSKANKGQKQCTKKAAKVVKKADICKKETAAQRIIATAKLLAWDSNTSPKRYQYPGGNPTKAFKNARHEVLANDGNWNPQSAKGASCLVFTSTVARASGVDRNFPAGERQYTYTSSKFKRITCKNCNPYKKSKPGDIVLYYDTKWGGKGHALIRGNGNVVYEAQYNHKTYGHTTKNKKSFNQKKAHVVILRPKD